jgi:hemerythrin-like domain-containing protein
MTTRTDGAATAGTPRQLTDTRDMNLVHAIFRREYRLLPSLIRGVDPADVQRSRAVGEHAQVFVTTLEHHHTNEDTMLWPKLHERVPAELEPLVDLMEDHHAQVHDLMEAIEPLLARWIASADARDRDHLADLFDRLYAILIEHLGAEERDVLPIMARNITAAEWTDFVEAGHAAIPGSLRFMALGAMLYDGDPEFMAEKVREIPAPIRPLMVWMARRAFRRYAFRIHGTPNP